MVFIDGQYLRSGLTSEFGSDAIDYTKLADFLRRSTEYGPFYLELVRAYYYDALPEDSEQSKLKVQEEYLRKIKDQNYFEVQLGRAKRDGKGNLKQKGVDTLLAIDLLTKAYEKQFDVAVLLSGDDDFLELVKAAKSTGARVYGAYFEHNTSADMKDSFDRRIPLEHKVLEEMRLP